MNIKLAICDDAQNQIEYVASLVSSWSTNKGYHCVVHTFPSAEAFLFEYEDDKTYDILLLDIEMGKMNGIDLAKNIRQTNDTVQIVFITGFPDFIAEGYDVSALHYLMKPVSQEKLHSVLDKAAANLKKAENGCASRLTGRWTIFRSVKSCTSKPRNNMLIFTLRRNVTV